MIIAGLAVAIFGLVVSVVGVVRELRTEPASTVMLLILAAAITVNVLIIGCITDVVA